MERSCSLRLKFRNDHDDHDDYDHAMKRERFGLGLLTVLRFELEFVLSEKMQTPVY